MKNKPHLVLDWIFNVPNQTLVCTINGELSYSAIEGGYKGINKTYNSETIFIEPNDWEEEKVWISENYGCLLYTSPSPRDRTRSRMPSSA